MGFDSRFTIIGHRGAAGLVPENTVPSFERAVSLGVDAIELDVHVVDGTLIVIHDAEVDRTTSGTGSLTDLGLDAIRALDAGHGAPVPTLAEVLAVVPAAVGVNVELKGPDTEAPVAEIVGADARDWLVSSFDHDRLRRFAKLAPHCPVAPLSGRFAPSVLKCALELDARSVNLSNRRVTARDVAAAHAEGREVYVYTVNEFERAVELRDWGVNGVFTDFPDRMAPLR